MACGELLFTDAMLEADTPAALAVLLASGHVGVVESLSSTKDKMMQHKGLLLPKDAPPGMGLEIFQRALGVVMTNAWKTGNSESASVGIFPRVSLINHACAPNAVLSMHRGEVLACRDIAEGEEITISYTCERVYAPTELRQQVLKRGWDFTCQCARCSDVRGDELLQSCVRQLTEPELAQLKAWSLYFSNRGTNAVQGLVARDGSGKQPPDPNRLTPELASRVLEVMRQDQAFLVPAHWVLQCARHLYLKYFVELLRYQECGSLEPGELDITAAHRSDFLAVLAAYTVANRAVLPRWCLAKKNAHSMILDVATRVPLSLLIQVVQHTFADNDPDFDMSTSGSGSKLWYLHNHECTVCGACKSAERPSVSACAGCGVAFYCSKVCQLADWRVHHKQVCKGRLA